MYSYFLVLRRLNGNVVHLGAKMEPGGIQADLSGGNRFASDCTREARHTHIISVRPWNGTSDLPVLSGYRGSW